MRVHAEAELVLEPHRPEEAQWIVEEDRVGDGTNAPVGEVGPSVVWIAEIARSHAHRDRVEREVARGEVRLDAVGTGREVDGLGRSAAATPGAVTLRERKGDAPEASRVANGGVPWLAARDVEIEQGTSEQLVADGATHDPRLLVAEHLANSLIHPYAPVATTPARRAAANASHPVVLSRATIPEYWP